MKRFRKFALIVGMLLLWLFGCSVHLEDGAYTPAAVSPAAESPGPAPLSAREELLCLQGWGAEKELQLEEDRGGEWMAQPLRWQLLGDRLHLRFFPESLAGREMVLKLTQPGSRAELKGEGLRFRMGFLLSPSQGEKREEQRRAEELAAQRALGDQIAQMALSFVGYNYKYGGKTPEEGFDCSGLVYYIYGQMGYSLQRVSNEQAKQGIPLQPEELYPGDLLAFYTSGKYVGHVGIYVGKGYYVHAMGSAYGVQLTALDDPYLPRVYEGRRLIGCEELMTSPAS